MRRLPGRLVHRDGAAQQADAVVDDASMAGVDAARRARASASRRHARRIDDPRPRRPPVAVGQAPEHREVGGALDGRAEPLVGRVDPDRHRARGRRPRAARDRARPRRAAAGRAARRCRAAPAAPGAARPAGPRRRPGDPARRRGAGGASRPSRRVRAEIRSAAPSCSWRSRSRRRPTAAAPSRRTAPSTQSVDRPAGSSTGGAGSRAMPRVWRRHPARSQGVDPPPG